MYFNSACYPAELDKFIHCKNSQKWNIAVTSAECNLTFDLYHTY